MVDFKISQLIHGKGKNFERSSPLSQLMIKLLLSDIYVAVVTAAGYGSDHKGYETRLKGLLEEIQCSNELSDMQKRRFYVMGILKNNIFSLV